MAKKTTEKRRLIKFSNYSMCVTIPKWVVDELHWAKGDELTLVTDIKLGKVTLFREKQGREKTNEKQEANELQPIPKLRW